MLYVITLDFGSLIASPTWLHFSFSCASNFCSSEVLFDNKAMSSATSRSVGAFAGYLRDLCGCSVRPSSLSRP